MIKANSVIIDNDPNLKCYYTMINTETLHNNTPMTLIITKNSSNKVCIPKDVTIGMSEEINSTFYSTNETTLISKIKDIKASMI